jgi:hypothetical protein
MTRDWAELRARLSGPTVIEALGIDLERPRCPSCRRGVEVAWHDDGNVSLRCTAERCRVGCLSWSWPEVFADAAWRTPNRAAAVARLLATVQESRSKEATAVERFRAILMGTAE